MTLYDYASYGDPDRRALTPVVHMQSASPPFIRFYFDLPPGSYHAVLRFPQTPGNAYICGRNGPLVVLPNRNRSLFIGGSAVADWHSVAAIAGTLPLQGVQVQVVVYDLPKHCGDEVHSYDKKTFKEIAPPQAVRAENDEGAYYANFHAYGTQDHTVALEFSGALFTRGAVLLTNTPTTAPGKPPIMVKNITPAVLAAAIDGGDRLVCVPGF